MAESEKQAERAKEDAVARAKLQQLLNTADETCRELRNKLTAMMEKIRGMVDASELEALRRELALMVPKSDLETALERERQLQKELDALREARRGMVPTGERDAALQDAQRAKEELRKHQEELERLRNMLKVEIRAG